MRRYKLSLFGAAKFQHRRLGHMRCCIRTSMKKTYRRFLRRLKKPSGQSLVEYSLILALIAVVAIMVLKGLGKKVNNTLSSVNANLP